MIAVQPEYIVPTFGVYVFDLDLYDGRTIQIGGTLSVGEDEKCTTTLYLKRKGFDENFNPLTGYYKVEIPNNAKVLIKMSGARTLNNNEFQIGIVSASILFFDTLSPSETYLFSSTGSITDDTLNVIKSTINNCTFETEVKPNQTPFDRVM